MSKTNKSFANCASCSRSRNKQFVCVTNSKKNLSLVDTLIVTSDPEEQEKIKEFSYKKYKKVLITSVVLCKKGEVKDEINEVINQCSNNFYKIVQMLSPKLIIFIGKLTNKFKLKCEHNWEYYQNIGEYMNIKEDKLSVKDAMGDIFNNKEESLNSMEDTLVNELAVLQNDPVISEELSEPPVVPSDGIYKYKIPDKYYTSDYKLIDVQYMSYLNKIIYVFRDKNNKKEFYEPDMKMNNYYWYESSGTKKVVEHINNLRLVVDNYKNRKLESNCYGSDVRPDVKHAVDYYLQSKGEPELEKSNILFFDIEIYAYKNKEFPTPDKAKYPINAISFKYNGELHVYLLSLKGEIDERINGLMKDKQFVSKNHLTLFTSEIGLLKAFFSFIRIHTPDIMTGWNLLGFDIPYIITRMKKLGIPADKLSPYSNIYADSKYARCIITGFVLLDQLKLYKDLTYTTESSYKLDNIARKVLKKEKVKYDGDLSSLYNDDIKTFIEYSANDTDLICELEENLGHIALINEIKRSSTTTAHATNSTIGQAEGLFLTSLKSKGLISKNYNSVKTDEKLPGGYVYNANGGLKTGLLCDFDFTSLYPSIINSWNIGPNTYYAKIDPTVMFNYLYKKEKLKDTKFKITIDPVLKNTEKIITLDQFEELIKKYNLILNISGCIFIPHESIESVYYPVIKSLFDNRKVYKSLMFDYKEKGNEKYTRIYDGKQMAMKILANSLYGVLGNEHFRFYNIDLARSITLTGQELIKYTGVHCNRFIEGKHGIDSDFVTTVENPMSYVVYGDTDSIFVDMTNMLKSKKIQIGLNDDVNKEVLTIQNYLNNELLKDYAITHNVPLNTSMLQLKNEFLFSHYYSLNAKKKYATKVISQEGRALSFIDIKGLEMKRADIPAYSKDLLNKILNMIFDENCTVSSIRDYVDNEKRRLADRVSKGDLSLSKMVNFSKQLKDYKNMPQHIKGMLMWNKLINEDFRYGSKGTLVLIKAFDVSKAPKHISNNYYSSFLKEYKPSELKCIVLPEEIEQLPEYFIPNTAEILRFAITDRSDLMLEPLIKTVPTFLTF